MSKHILYIVHCIDTEGPLRETMEATFKRIHAQFGLELAPSLETLRKLQQGGIDLGGIEKEVALFVDPGLINYHSNWDQVDVMLRRIMAPEFRKKLPDSFGGGWKYSWHCVAHVGYEDNPRSRDIGYHNVFDHFSEMVQEMGRGEDDIQFHYHPISFSKQAHHGATAYFSNGDSLFQILSRRIIDRNWFPSVNRPGFNVLRPDSHWFVEQYFPFEYANQATDEVSDNQKDFAPGRFGDWRRAPRNWQPYHPSHDDYQTPGYCRRWIMRCLNVGTRTKLLSQQDVDEAFAQSAEGKPTILSFTNHDFRDMAPDVEYVQAMLKDSMTRYPEVKIKYCTGRQAAREALGIEEALDIRISLDLKGDILTVRAKAPTFGPQPFLALKTYSGQYFHDNLDFQEQNLTWTYTFEERTVPLQALEKVGVGSAFADGRAFVSVLDVRSGQITETLC